MTSMEPGHTGIDPRLSFDDPLLDGLLILCKLHGATVSRASLSAGPADQFQVLVTTRNARWPSACASALQTVLRESLIGFCISQWYLIQAEICYLLWVYQAGPAVPGRARMSITSSC